MDSNESPDLFITELISIVERALNYAHTGNAKVLCRPLMDPFWVSLGIIYDGFPSLSSLAVIEYGGAVSIRKSAWPEFKKSSKPYSGSFAAIKFHYGEEFAFVSLVLFQVPSTPVRGFYPPTFHPCSPSLSFGSRLFAFRAFYP